MANLRLTLDDYADGDPVHLPFLAYLETRLRGHHWHARDIGDSMTADVAIVGAYEFCLAVAGRTTDDSTFTRFTVAALSARHAWGRPAKVRDAFLSALIDRVGPDGAAAANYRFDPGPVRHRVLLDGLAQACTDILDAYVDGVVQPQNPHAERSLRETIFREQRLAPLHRGGWTRRAGGHGQ